MPLQRRLSWNAARRHLLNDRNFVVVGVASARSLIQALNQIRRTRLVTPAGAFDRAAIMRAAVEAAKAHQRRTGATWTASMSVGLTAAWQAAKAARLSAVAPEHPPERRVRETSRDINFELVSKGGEGRGAGCGEALSPAPLAHPSLTPFTRGLPGAGASLSLTLR